MIGGPIEMLLPERFRHGHKGQRSGYQHEPRTRLMGAGLELLGRRKDGSEFPVEISLSPMESEGQTLVTSVIRDISERKRFEEQLQRKNQQLEEQNERVQAATRLKSEFLANMSHELRTPLNAIIGFSELMHDGKVGPVAAEHKEYLGDILRSSKHLLQLINDIVDLAKVESGKMEFRPESIDLAQLLAEVRNILRTMVAQKRIELTFDIAANLGPIVADPPKLKQILYNYLSNAIKFTPDEGQVTILVGPEGPDHFRIDVADTGPGIRPEEFDKLFLEFQQLDASSSKRHPGTGLGLALTRRIVEAQGGQVGVHSVPGEGSTFFAILPRRATAIIEADQESKPAVPGTPGHELPSILIIEDEHNDRRWLETTIAAAGYAVTTASTGAEAIARCQEQVFAAITLDILLPDMSGWDVLRAIRADDRNWDVPVVVVTVVVDKAMPMIYPIQDVLSKPVRADELLTALKRAKRPASGSSTIMIVDDNAGDRKLRPRS